MYMRIVSWLCLCILGGQVYAATETLLLDNQSPVPTDERIKRVVVQHDASLNPAGGITIEAWVRRANLSNCQTIVGKGFATAYWLGLCSGKIRYYTNGSGTSMDGSTELVAGDWQHIAVTFDGVNRHYYLNGNLDLVATTPGTLGVNAQALGIGGEGESVSFPASLFPFSGRISEVRIWGYARSQEQIRSAMYQQITKPQPGLIGVWALEGGADDLLGSFSSVLAPGASWSGIDSPAIPHDPLRIRNASSITVDGLCNEAGYNTATVVPAWYEDGDRLLAEDNPQRILLGANASYVFICMPDRKSLNDPIYTVEVDVNNDGANQIQSDDHRFRFWPGNDGLTTWVGGSFGTWGSTTNPTGLAAQQGVPVEFTRDFEMRIPRSLFPPSISEFRIRASHNFLVSGNVSRTVEWPLGSNTQNPSSWQAVTIDLESVISGDSYNPHIRAQAIDTRPLFSDGVQIIAEGFDDVDMELVEIFVDGVLVEDFDYPGDTDISYSEVHSAQYTVGRHSLKARAFDRSGRESQSGIKGFRVTVDGVPPRILFSVDPPEPPAGSSVTVTARAIDASGVRVIQIRNLLGGLPTNAKSCEFPAGGSVETCVWTFTPQNEVTMLSMVATAIDAEGDFESTISRTVLIGNDGPDRDNDGLSNHVEFGLCTNASNPDTDSDGLSDGWEILGIQFDDGSIEPLPDYGTNPCSRNLLLQLDYETGAKPSESGIENLISQYRQNRINVYMETNERPQPVIYDQSHISSSSAPYQMDVGDYYFNPQRIWAFFYGYSTQRSGRSWAWNRMMNLNQRTGGGGFCFGGTAAGTACQTDFTCLGGGSCQAGCTDGPNKSESCVGSRDCPMEDGEFARCAIPCSTNPAVFGSRCGFQSSRWSGYGLIHELGHTAGLGHGGLVGTLTKSSDGGFVTVESDWDNDNYKPNQLSVMNYFYSEGELCMMPLPGTIPDGYEPDINGLLTYLKRDMGDLNEQELNEASTSVFSTRLRAQDCTHSDPSSFPVFRYTCKIGETQFEVLSNGLSTLARRQEDGDWDYSIPAHDPGIDWNCDGEIFVNLVPQNIDGPGSTGGGMWEGSGLDTELRARAEFPALPLPVSCHILYRARCEDRANSCYVWPTAYQNGIPTLASGVEPVDCRDEFLANRSTNNRASCRGGSDDEFGTSICPRIDRDSLLVSSAAESEFIGLGGLEIASGLESDVDSEPNENFARPLPGVEYCDFDDNDGDGEVDEGCRDQDSDGIPDVIDNCMTIANAGQEDRDRDGLGDICQFPKLSKLEVSWDGNRTVNLIWANDGIPLRGAVVYRYGIDHPNPLYRGNLYPSTLGNEYADTVGWGDTYTYVVRPLNLNGQEGAPLTIQVQVDIDNNVFKDSFENP